MSIERPRVPWFGVVLIVVGGVLLLSKLNVIELEFMQVFWPVVMLFGLLRVGQGFSRNIPRRVFWGTLLFLYGLFFFLRTWEYVDMHPHRFLPASFLIVGIAFFMMYLNNVKEWLFLVPAVILTGIGGAFILTEVGYLDRWEVWEAVRLYWPIALVLVGIAIILRRRSHTQTPDVPPPASA